ncbi:MAG: 1-acyl-sn-glycerol-3-phosphate acyltransferase [Ferruginibacter sp.]
MLHHLFKAYLKFTGWKAVNKIPPGLRKFILVVGPHTSSWDIFMGFAFRSYLKLDYIKFIAKKELFNPPFGTFFRKLGGVAVDRASNNNFVDQVVNMFKANESFAIAMSPEGTRKKIDRLRTGFYHIAKKAKIPIVLLAFDFGKKEFRFAEPFYTTDNELNDIRRVLLFFSEIKGKNPELGLGHLSKAV